MKCLISLPLWTFCFQLSLKLFTIAIWTTANCHSPFSTPPLGDWGPLLRLQALHGVSQCRFDALVAHRKHGNRQRAYAGRGKYPPRDG